MGFWLRSFDQSDYVSPPLGSVSLLVAEVSRCVGKCKLISQTLLDNVGSKYDNEEVDTAPNARGEGENARSRGRQHREDQGQPSPTWLGSITAQRPLDNTYQVWSCVTFLSL